MAAEALQFMAAEAWLNYIDIAVSVTNVFETAISMYSSSTALPFPPVLFRLLRLGKLARAIRVVSMTSVLASLQLLVKCLGSSRDMLFWSFCLLTFVQCVAGMSLRCSVGGTTLSMFEILFANWGPSCRILVENVSEWFSVFFLLYRCVLGFAIVNVVNSVFVQQTMKTASSDEELAFKQKQRDAELYTKKVRKLFQTMDASGDGAINLEEFAKLVQSPKLRFWMSQLEYHDLLSLFEFLDNGDGQITLTEFIEGAARLRGSAKALDIWRMETKVEVLFEEGTKKRGQMSAEAAVICDAKDRVTRAAKLSYESVAARWAGDDQFQMRMMQEGKTKMDMQRYDYLSSAILPDLGRTEEQRHLGAGSQYSQKQGVPPAKLVFYAHCEVEPMRTLHLIDDVAIVPIGFSYMGAFLPPRLYADIVSMAPEARRILTFDGEVHIDGTSVQTILEEIGHIVNDSLRSAELQAKATARLAEQNRQVAARHIPKGKPAATPPMYRGYTQAQWDEWHRSLSSYRGQYSQGNSSFGTLLARN
eukprot:s261_g2.t1